MNRPRKSKGPYPPCFYLKHGAYYLVRDNKWKRLGSDLSLALAEYGRLMEAAKLGGMPQALQDHLDKLKRQTKPQLASSTLTQYKHACEILKRKLKQFEPGEVKAKHVAAIKQSLAGTPNMANRALSFLRGCFSDLVEAQLIDSNPCVGIKRFEEEKRTRLISDNEWGAIYAKAGERLRIIMTLQFLTGQRIGDVLSIRRSQIGEDGITFKQKKTGAQLLVRWTPDLRAAVVAADSLHPVKAVTLLRGRDGNAPDYRTVHEQWVVACTAAEVEDARPNDGRARSATVAKRQGKSARALLGHTTDANTGRYLRDRETPEVDGPVFTDRKGADGKA